MARDINSLYELTRYIVRKQRGVYLTTAQFSANLDAGQYDAFEEYFKLYGIDQTVHDALRPFRTSATFTTAIDGAVAYQTNYLHLLGTPYTIVGSTVGQVKFVQEDEYAFALSSKIRQPTAEYPIAIENAFGFTLYPSIVHTGSYFYLKKPRTPVWAGTQIGRVVTYNPLTSVQLEWVEGYWNNILAKALIYSGINMDEKGISEYADKYNSETKA